MDTKIIKVTKEDSQEKALQEAAEILKNGGLVAFPTETVYGLGADGLNIKAVQNIFKAKGRPSDNPLILHIGSKDIVPSLVSFISEEAKKFMKAFWPGPLTLIMPKSDKIPFEATGGLSTVAIRFPSHPIATKLLQIANIPVAAPSANLSGKPSPTEANHVFKDLNGKIDIILDGGTCEFGLESTVLDLTSKIPVVLRPGSITLEMLREVINTVEMDPAILKNNMENKIIAKAPGMKYTHYAPKANMILIVGQKKEVVRKISALQKEYVAQGKSVGILCTEEEIKQYEGDYILSVGSKEDKKEIGKNIFKILRRFDELPVEIILAEGFEEKEMGLAIMNRLKKAAGYNIIYT